MRQVALIINRHMVGGSWSIILYNLPICNHRQRQVTLDIYLLADDRFSSAFLNNCIFYIVRLDLCCSNCNMTAKSACVEDF